jgi:hypothetical protein
VVIAVFDDHTPGPATRYIELPAARRPAMQVACCRDETRHEMVSDIVTRAASFLPAVDGRKKPDPFRDLDLVTKIALRWTLRDIEAKRWMITPIDPIHLEQLMALDLVEIRNDDPVLTKAGLDALGTS